MNSVSKFANGEKNATFSEQTEPKNTTNKHKYHLQIFMDYDQGLGQVGGFDF
jgi:hypothetical protein